MFLLLTVFLPPFFFFQQQQNHLGQVNVRDLIVTLRRDTTVSSFLHMGQKVTQEGSARTLQHIFQEIDADHSDAISWPEFERYFLTHAFDPDSQCFVPFVHNKTSSSPQQRTFPTRAAPKKPSNNTNNSTLVNSSNIVPTMSSSRRSTLNMLFGGSNHGTTTTTIDTTTNNRGRRTSSSQYTTFLEDTAKNQNLATTILPESVVTQVVNSAFKVRSNHHTDNIAIKDVRDDRRNTLAILFGEKEDTKDQDVSVEVRVLNVINAPWKGTNAPDCVKRDRRGTLALLFGGGGLM